LTKNLRLDVTNLNIWSFELEFTVECFCRECFDSSKISCV